MGRSGPTFYSSNIPNRLQENSSAAGGGQYVVVGRVDEIRKLGSHAYTWSSNGSKMRNKMKSHHDGSNVQGSCASN